MTTYLSPVTKPTSQLMRIMFAVSRKMFGLVPGPFSVFSTRMPFAFLSFFGKVSRLDKKLTLPHDLVVLVRERVASINMCTWCMDAQQWYVRKRTPEMIPKLDALPDYTTSPMFSSAERAALDYASELTEQKRVSRKVFERVAEQFDERQICELSWLVSSEHLYNINNLGLGIESDGLCEVKPAST
ncbi:MAG: carboxymuconolactone decarboxylase family protein [Nocardioidaceae bacterium]